VRRAVPGLPEGAEVLSDFYPNTAIPNVNRSLPRLLLNARFPKPIGGARGTSRRSVRSYYDLVARQPQKPALPVGHPVREEHVQAVGAFSALDPAV
jgi:hypothetical protein